MYLEMTEKQKKVSFDWLKRAFITAAIGFFVTITISGISENRDDAKELKKQVNCNTQAIEIINKTMPDEAQIRQMLKDNNSEIVKELFEKGYIRIREKR